MSQTGNFFENFAPGQVIRHALGRTLTDADNIWFTGITHNPNQAHFNADYAARTPYGKMLVNSCFTLALVTNWKCFCTLEVANPPATIHFFACQGGEWVELTTTTDEAIEWWWLEEAVPMVN